MPRIIGGARKGRRLHAPGGRSTRPTGARVRQSLFDMLADRNRGCCFLDLFAGAGSVGLEARSRGAARVVLVDKDKGAVEAIRRNLACLDEASEAVDVRRADYRSALTRLAGERMRFDLVYLDPPYETVDYSTLLGRVAASGVLATNAIVVVEHFHKRALPEKIEELRRFRSVKIGDHRLSLYRPCREKEQGKER
jgi:16S rRNA (guanine(966)-N(2))-methyltransferase RsmD